MSRVVGSVLVGLALSACGGGGIGQEVGSVTFSYGVFLPDGAGGGDPVGLCEAAGIEQIRLLVGDDVDENGALDDAEVQEQLSTRCRGGDADVDGLYSEEELGLYGPLEFLVAGYNAFAIELEDFDGQVVPWSVLGSGNAPLARVTFLEDYEISATPLEFTFDGPLGELEILLP